MRFTSRLARSDAGTAPATAAVVTMRLRFGAGALLAALAGLAPVSSASAAIDPASYQHVDVLSGYPGGFISCPAGMKAVASGATGSGLHDVLTSGLTTFDGNGAFATALGNGGNGLQISARCVDAPQVQASTLATNVVRDHRPNGYLQFGRATCPPQSVAYGGGGFVSQPGGQPFGASYVYASMPDAGGTAWVLAAAATLFPDKELWIGTHCLPRRQFGQILTVTATDTAPPGVPHAPNYPTLFVSARCPAGYSAYAGGASLHNTGSSTPAPVGYLNTSNMTADDRGWFARGWIHTEGAQLTATAQCMTRVIDRPRS